ncbi:hypothetical protein [Xanthomonas sp. XNM01]|uniref:hypothetical protein n=1 Tax=Xanthomonas sp. XNM01 TaxID=2769289 RepID=UPI001784C2E4|nr:hypothetical protein [Xanthomonas sp. XNM01]
MGYTNTCASWASDTAHRVTGERVNASELLGVTDTPRQLGKSIKELEEPRATAPDSPQTQGEIERGGSSSLSAAPDNGQQAPGQVERLAAAQDPERLQQAMRDLQGSEQGRAFDAQVQQRMAEAERQEQAGRTQSHPSIERA